MEARQRFKGFDIIQAIVREHAEVERESLWRRVLDLFVAAAGGMV
jgi:hypothetical protein